MDYKQLYKPDDWLTASVVMVFIPTDGRGYRSNGSRISITGRKMQSTLVSLFSDTSEEVLNVRKGTFALSLKCNKMRKEWMDEMANDFIPWLLFTCFSFRDQRGQCSGFKLLSRPRAAAPSVRQPPPDLWHAHPNNWLSLQRWRSYTLMLRSEKSASKSLESHAERIKKI